MQDLRGFSVPKGFRGGNVIKVQLWWAVQATLFSPVTAGVISLARFFAPSVWRENRKKRSHSTVGENYLSVEINHW